MSGYTCLSLSASGSILVTETNCSDAVTVGWVSNPGGRGTTSLILSCILTLGLCVWSAMHLNIPAPTDTERQTWWRNFRWTFMGVFGPELVMYVAWSQWSSSKALSAKVQEYVCTSQEFPPCIPGIENEKRGHRKPARRWTLMHSFYASMGGFVFDIDPSEEYPALFSDHRRLTLTARGVALVAQLGHLPNISKEDIADKSKADGLAKAFVCLQAGWVVTQVISRRVVSLPVTLLEVNTLAHAFCAFVIYILWWHKPRLIEQPTVLSGDWVKPVCAYMYMSSQISGWNQANQSILRKTWKDPELQTMVLVTSSNNVAESTRPVSENGIYTASKGLATYSLQSMPTLETQNSSLKEPAGVPLMTNVVETSAVSLASLGAVHEYFKPLPVSLAEEEGGILSIGAAKQTAKEHAMQEQRWQLAAEAVRKYPILRERFSALSSHNSDSAAKYLKPSTEELVTRYSSNWPTPTLLKQNKNEGQIIGMALWCASMCYGSLHLAAWDYYFPSRTEAILWKSSAICITASGFTWLLINGLAHYSAYWNSYWGRFVKFRCSWYSYVIIGFLSAVCGMAYILGRLYLVVEAFISIRKLPLAAYATPDWIQTIPHL